MGKPCRGNFYHAGSAVLPEFHAQFLSGIEEREISHHFKEIRAYGIQVIHSSDLITELKSSLGGGPVFVDLIDEETIAKCFCLETILGAN
jgi:hypothetical protein